MRQFLVALIVCVAAMAQPAHSQSSDIEELRDAFAETYGTGFRSNRMASYLTSLFRRFDKDRNGIDGEEIDRISRIIIAQVRASNVGRLLRHDLDGDGSVTRDEVSEYFTSTLFSRDLKPSGELMQRSYARLKRSVDRVMALDPNGDDRIEPSEYKHLKAEGRLSNTQLGQIALARAFLKLDPN